MSATEAIAASVIGEAIFPNNLERRGAGDGQTRYFEMLWRRQDTGLGKFFLRLSQNDLDIDGGRANDKRDEQEAQGDTLYHSPQMLNGTTFDFVPVVDLKRIVLIAVAPEVTDQQLQSFGGNNRLADVFWDEQKKKDSLSVDNAIYFFCNENGDLNWKIATIDPKQHGRKNESTKRAPDVKEGELFGTSLVDCLEHVVQCGRLAELDGVDDTVINGRKVAIKRDYNIPVGELGRQTMLKLLRTDGLAQRLKVIQDLLTGSTCDARGILGRLEELPGVVVVENKPGESLGRLQMFNTEFGGLKDRMMIEQIRFGRNDNTGCMGLFFTLRVDGGTLSARLRGKTTQVEIFQG